MTEREGELTDRLLDGLAGYLGPNPDEPTRRTTLIERSPTMLAAWTQSHLLDFYHGLEVFE